MSFKISCAPETPNIVKVNISMINALELKRCYRFFILSFYFGFIVRLDFNSIGAQEVLDRHFPGMETSPDAGFDIAIQFDCDSLSNPESFLEEISNLKRHISSGPLDRAFSALNAKTSGSLPLMSTNYRKSEIMFVCPAASKVVVVFLVDFNDTTDKALARVFLQEFVEAQRMVRTAPPVSFSREPPGELAGLSFPYNADAAGFISFALEERHVTGARQDAAISLLVGFRNYLHYHIKCSKTYLHMRMRKKVSGWMQVLNRAMPDVETEKKTAAGKTFTRK